MWQESYKKQVKMYRVMQFRSKLEKKLQDHFEAAINSFEGREKEIVEKLFSTSDASERAAKKISKETGAPVKEIMKLEKKAINRLLRSDCHTLDNEHLEQEWEDIMSMSEEGDAQPSDGSIPTRIN